MRRLLSSTLARLVVAIFLLQLLSSGVAIYFLRTQMLDVVHSDRVRQLVDARSDLMAAYYEGGHEELEEYIIGRKATDADPLLFVALTGKKTMLLSNIVEIPRGLVVGRPVTVQLLQANSAMTSEGLALATRLPDGDLLIVGALAVTERGFDLAFAEAIGLTLLLTIVLAITSALSLGFIISRRTHRIAETAGALAAGDFAARIPKEDYGDGFDLLRRQMNFMAERIGTLVRQLQSVTGALAHDLQSPVARLRAAIDTAMTKVDDPSASEALTMARSDAEALQAMLANALELSRLEGGTIQDRREMVDLGEVVADMVELYEPLAEQSGIDLEADIQSLHALADRELVSRALSNLIDNAIKYGGDQITVVCRTAGALAEIVVLDNGPGIASEEHEKVIERFTRLDNARTRSGAGLGLAMAEAVAKLHGGSLELSESDLKGRGGLAATIRLARS